MYVLAHIFILQAKKMLLSCKNIRKIIADYKNNSTFAPDL